MKERKKERKNAGTPAYNMGAPAFNVCDLITPSMFYAFTYAI